MMTITVMLMTLHNDYIYNGGVNIQDMAMRMLVNMRMHMLIIMITIMD